MTRVTSHRSATPAHITGSCITLKETYRQQTDYLVFLLIQDLQYRSNATKGHCRFREKLSGPLTLLTAGSRRGIYIYNSIYTSTENMKLGDVPLTSRYVVARVVPAEFVALQM